MLAGNVERAPLSSFVDEPGANLHLAPGAAIAIAKAVPLADRLLIAIDAEPRGAAVDVRADEYMRVNQQNRR